ncbi:MAG: PQQ-binding-like beta-propeller repeat protein [Desulfurococcaceae archaeon]|nr:PQQ-binding-like beta-propeller repeat protein [Sulfolobales archaeon]MDW8169953.1 PQQ-binding-like beta-propeller repeat protein [Desulfurococcaceae archaeon]
MRFKYVLIVIIIASVLLASSLLLIFFRLPEVVEEPKEPPEKLKEIRIEPIPTVKIPEPPPSMFLPEALPWLVEKGTVRTDVFYGSGVPRRPEVALKLNISANMAGKLAEAIVEGNRVFLADNEGVYALNKSSGELLWGVEVYFDNLMHRELSGPGPIYKWRSLGLWGFVKTYGVGKYLYVATSFLLPHHGEEDASLLALNKDNGELVWRVTLKSEEGARKSSVTSNLIVADGKVFVGSIGYEGLVFAVSEDGEVIWRRSVGGNVRGLTYGDGILFVTSEYSNKLHAFNPENGELLWIYEHDWELTTPSYRDGRVILADLSGSILAVSSNGKLLWERPLGIGGDVDKNSYIALSDKYVYAIRSYGERPRNLYVLDFNGNVVGNYTLTIDEDGGIPAVSRDIVALPVLNRNGEGKVYLLWRGLHKLSEFHFKECSGWMPKVSIAYGEIFVVACPRVMYKLVDEGKPVISRVNVTYNRTLIIKADVFDNQSALYKVLLVYSINNSHWNYREMRIASSYADEPVGGYGLEEETYITEIPLEIAKIEFYIIAIDNTGNYEATAVYGYRIYIMEG